MAWKSLALVASLASFGGAVALAQTPQDRPASTAAAAGAPADGSDAPAAALFEKSCSGCHDLSQAASQQTDEAGWKATIETMVGNGAQVSDADQVRLAKYLARTHGPAAPPAKP